MRRVARMTDESKDRAHFLLLNIGHFLDHLFTLIFATVAAIALTREWGLSYAALLAYATPGFFAFGLFSLPAGWLADKWSRDGMMAVFFLGIGAASIATAFAQSPLQIAVGLFGIGIFAAIYHPVGLAIVTERWRNTGMRLAVNGVWGNFGVGSAALITGYFIDNGGWRLAFIAPGLVSIAVGLVYAYVMRAEIAGGAAQQKSKPVHGGVAMTDDLKVTLWRLSMIIFVTTAVSSLIFQSTTFALPKVFEERLGGIAGSATTLGWMAFLVFAIASIGQLIVGHYLDRIGPRSVFLATATLQALFFALMPGLENWAALACALAFMLAAFGAVPINDYMIGKMAQGEFRARVYGVRYVLSFSVFAVALPLIAFIYARFGFDTLFRLLSLSALIIVAAAWQLPRVLPTAAPVPAAT
jgi:MFS family permease